MPGGPALPERYPVPWTLWKMSRPSHLLLIALVYALGVAAGGVLGGEPPATRAVLAGWVALVPVAASVHYANEHADAWTDRLTWRTPFSGGSGALPRTRLSRTLAERAATTALLAGAVLGAGAVLAGLLTPVAGALLGAIAVLGWGYSVDPLALGWRGSGEVDNALVGGVVLPVYGFAVQTGRLTPAAVAVALPFGVVVFCNLLDTTWPDRWADATVGKRTLATRWPAARLRTAYRVGIGAYVATLAVGWAVAMPRLPCVAGLVALPLLVWGDRGYTRDRSPLPTVLAMVLMALAQALAWGWLWRGMA